MLKVLCPVVLVLSAFALGGCLPLRQAAPEPLPPSPTKHGVIFLAGGISGFDTLGLAAHWTLPRVGIEHELRDVNWNHGKGHWLMDLQDTRHVLQKAKELADEIRRLKEADPDRPVYLVGHSAGAGLMLAAAEQLPPATIERIILLSPAVAPTYDLRQAFLATRNEIVSFHSSLDSLVLGWGTSEFGTVDRVYGPAAGRDGFQVPPDLNEADRLLYGRLVDIGWTPDQWFKQRGGLHGSTVRPAFLARYVAPWLK